MSLLHSSTRRPPPLQPEDYDHEINLEDHTRTDATPRESRSRSARQQDISPASDSSSRRASDVPLYKHQSPMQLRKELTKRKYKKYQDRSAQKSGFEGPVNEDAAEDIENGEPAEPERGRTRDSNREPGLQKEPETAIDVLYENQRGGFLCGMALFSSKALGNADPAPWTNVALKTSATDITNAQVPDPSWEWVWKEWTINHTEEVDEDGWEYSFMFSKKFSWHGSSWWNSFVRRRAWIRKRAKTQTGHIKNDAHQLNSDYFTIHSSQQRSRSRASSLGRSIKNRYSVGSLNKLRMEPDLLLDNVCDIGSLMTALRFARIDREKTEAVENFIKNGGDDLYYLRDHMHEIMGSFIFQASRRSLLAHLLKIFNEASEQLKDGEVLDADSNLSRKKKIENLDAAVKCADEEVRKLEFWSDVKEMAENGLTQGAVDGKQGWGDKWTGLDDSGPRDVLSEPKLSGKESCNDGTEATTGNGTVSKGKGKAKAEDQNL